MGRKVSIAFIGGTGRSGTSITRKLLSKGCDVAALPFEHRILIDPDGPIQFYESLGRYREPYTIDLAIQRFDLNCGDCSRYFHQKSSRFTYSLDFVEVFWMASIKNLSKLFESSATI